MAYSLNKALIIGNLTRDPEARATPSGQNVCNFGVATSRQWNDASGMKQEQSEFHNVVAWGKLADICSQYLKKGRKVYVEGRLQTREWQSPEGVKKNRTEIVADNVIILDRAGTPATSAPGADISSADAAPSAPTAAPTEEIRIEDIPF